jgi:phosphoglycolate phosphatase
MSVTPPPPLRAIIFDLDGTLLDTLEDLADSMNDALRRIALPVHPLSAYRQFVGDGAQMLAHRAVPVHRRDPVTVDFAYSAYLECYARRWHLKSRAYPGIPELLDHCVTLGLRLAVLSNKADHFTRKVVSALLPHWPWSVIRGQVSGVPRKPAPDGAFAVARELGVAPAECLLLGDSAVDIACARTAGMASVGALWGFRPKSELESAGPDDLANSPAEVSCILRKSES